MKNYAPYIGIVFVLGVLWYAGFFREETLPPINPVVWETKTDDQADVTVTVTPRVLSLQSRGWKFDIILNTHSVELDQDMLSVVVLVDDAGTEYKPGRFEGAGPGGHHREGILAFESIMPPPQHVTLKVRNIGNVERTFSWTLIE